MHNNVKCIKQSFHCNSSRLNIITYLRSLKWKRNHIWSNYVIRTWTMDPWAYHNVVVTLDAFYRICNHFNILEILPKHVAMFSVVLTVILEICLAKRKRVIMVLYDCRSWPWWQQGVAYWNKGKITSNRAHADDN